MKLYDVPRNSWVVPVEDAQAPPGARPVSEGEPVLFHQTDGMYSYCHDRWGNVVHLSAWQDVVVVDEPK